MLYVFCCTHKNLENEVLKDNGLNNVEYSLYGQISIKYPRKGNNSVILKDKIRKKCIICT